MGQIYGGSLTASASQLLRVKITSAVVQLFGRFHSGLILILILFKYACLVVSDTQRNYGTPED